MLRCNLQGLGSAISSDLGGIIFSQTLLVRFAPTAMVALRLDSLQCRIYSFGPSLGKFLWLRACMLVDTFQKGKCVHAECEKRIDGFCNEGGECVCRPGYALFNGSCIDKKSVKTVISLATKWIPTDNNSSNDFKVLQADICAA
ncbi:hypothetical protein BSL78_24938 [Apostichopus japonicus]|uniref:Uncharacterized protein n=1 Tax=Stichopus japonicus TaxID=307972 RepID=A0A2G8JR89_STIJA|nr:hypothetical protein BSL78_24938 [Apostichopus japonicus]